ncbi:MAG: minichromosome maintenance protein MCM [Candidatus Hydrothermae bacterium]|nr:minichromosome maintenance protein MCM [Candidatus Hydrothermae bacterium]
MNERVEEINSYLENKYSSASLSQGISRVLNNTDIVEVKVVKGVKYYKLLDDVKSDIAKMLKIVFKEQEIQAKLEAEKISEREAMIDTFVEFLRNYLGDDGKPIYMNKIADLITITGSKSLLIDYSNLNSFNSTLAEKLLEDPEKVIPIAQDAIFIVLKEDFLEEKPFLIHPRFYNLPRTVFVKNVGDKHINKLIQVEAVVTRVSELKPFVTRAVYLCKHCGHEMVRLQKPFSPMVKVSKCENCGSRHIELDVTKSTFIPFQTVRFQELPNNMKPGEPPRFIDAILLDDLVNVLIPGTRVRITGILRLLPDNTSFATFKKLLEVNCIEVLDQGLEDIKIEEEDVTKIKEFLRRPDLKDLIIESVVPTVKGYDWVKWGLTLAMFGGSTITFKDGTRLRGEIHVLLVGDPSTAKSTIVRWFINIAPRGVYTSGRGATSAGITAAAVYDEISKSWMLEGGALVLADQGVAIIDELDKLSDDAKKSLHEALEHGTVSVSKAGINANLNARATLIAAANPKYGRFNPMKSVPEQLDLDPALLSRFDLIYVFRDEPDETWDSEVARHILKVRNKGKIAVEVPIPTELLRKWIAYARLNYNPMIPEDLWDLLVNYYVSLRKRAKKQEEDKESGIKPLPITPRQFEAMIRLSQARARMYLRDTVTREDVDEALRIVEQMLRMVAMDEEGEFDVSILEVGRSSRKINKEATILDIIKELQDLEDWGAPEDDIIKESMRHDMSAGEVMAILGELIEEGKIYMPRERYYKARG